MATLVVGRSRHPGGGWLESKGMLGAAPWLTKEEKQICTCEVVAPPAADFSLQSLDKAVDKPCPPAAKQA